VRYYVWRQNNSGGSFIGPTSIIVCAKNLEDAENIAEDNGVYYDGVSADRDCGCCGDRWSSPDEYSSLDKAKQWVSEDVLIINSKLEAFKKELNKIRNDL